LLLRKIAGQSKPEATATSSGEPEPSGKQKQRLSFYAVVAELADAPA
jgi:hypothetical protein